MTHPVLFGMMSTTVVALGVVLFCVDGDEAKEEAAEEQFGLSATPMGFVFSPKRFPVVLLAAPAMLLFGPKDATGGRVVGEEFTDVVSKFCCCCCIIIFKEL